MSAAPRASHAAPAQGLRHGGAGLHEPRDRRGHVLALLHAERQRRLFHHPFFSGYQRQRQSACIERAIAIAIAKLDR
ncbi:hypothetical protein AWV79_11265 [Cupriavidus sp. UYMMa02A]|nr:hypothetical protein AWV79_11265 [Cupriavidus sp. UYMMa02A]